MYIKTTITRTVANKNINPFFHHCLNKGVAEKGPECNWSHSEWKVVLCCVWYTTNYWFAPRSQWDYSCNIPDEKFMQKLLDKVSFLPVELCTFIPGCAILRAVNWNSGITCSRISLAGRARAEPCLEVDGMASSKILPLSVVNYKFVQMKN